MRSAAALGLLLLAACQPSPTSLELQLDCTPSTRFRTLTVWVQSAALAIDASRDLVPDGGEVQLPDRLIIPIADRAAPLQLRVEAIDVDGRRRSATGNVTSVAHQRVGLTLDLSLPALCLDSRQDGDESGIDCGGTQCPACGPGIRCLTDSDCQSTACASQGICALASGPPFWRVGTTLKPNRWGFGAALVPDGGVFVVGGESGTPLARVDIYDAQLDAFRTGPALPLARTGLGLGHLAGRLWAVGGSPSPTRVDTLIPGEATWTPGPPLPAAHSEPGVAVSGDRLYVAGGFEAGNPSDRVEVLTADGGWTSAQGLPVGRVALALAAMSDGTLFAVGGTVGSGPLGVVEHYLPGQDVWVKAAPLPTPRTGPAAIEAADGRLWVIGGSAGGSLRTVEAYYPPPIDKWVGLAGLQKDRESCSVHRLPDGRLMVIAGLSSGIQPENVEFYGPVVSVSPATFRAGMSGTVTGDNFAADAGVVVTLSPDNWVLGRGSTDVQGALVKPIEFFMPSVPPGDYQLRVIDSRSQYPIVTRVTVAP
ncbi:MAG: repeat protein [Myxococcaceae bacterium]|nr:repeat protein [Myxococcaceae bacterium]